MIYTSKCGRYEIEENNLGKYYYKDGKLHRDGDLPAIEWTDGTKKYYKRTDND